MIEICKQLLVRFELLGGAVTGTSFLCGLSSNSMYHFSTCDNGQAICY